MKKKITYLAIIFILLLPISFANGGCIKFADDVLVQLSISPLVPIVNKQASFLISFANIKKEIINDEINGKLKITKNNGIILTKDFKIKNGILDLKHIFKKVGLYEIFLEFDYKNKTYTPEDFLIEVKPLDKKFNLYQNLIFVIIGVIIGVAISKLIKK